MYSVTKTFKFSAAHLLEHVPEADHPCRRLHGHNYEIALVVEASTLDESGFVVDTRHLDFFRAFVDRCLDHRNLNEVLPELNGQTSGEKLAAYLFGWFQENAPMSEGRRSVAQLLKAVRVCETPTVCIEYSK